MTETHPYWDEPMSDDEFAQVVDLYASLWPQADMARTTSGLVATVRHMAAADVGNALMALSRSDAFPPPPGMVFREGYRLFLERQMGLWRAQQQSLEAGQ